jgi:hypothetical protein
MYMHTKGDKLTQQLFFVEAMGQVAAHAHGRRRCELTDIEGEQVL